MSVRRNRPGRREGTPLNGLGPAIILAIATAFCWRSLLVPSYSVNAPNVVLILADDQGSLDLNCYGSKDLDTPNLDRLAREGIRFTQFYVGAPVCSPSRASLLTGRYPQRAGVPGNVSSRPGHKGMPTEQLTIAELLKPAGYHTALFGKWHLGTVPECEPLAQGFDEFLGHKGGCIDNFSHFFYWDGPNRHDLWKNHEELWEDGTHFSDIIVREARRFIRENRDRPFFLYLPFNVPHYPVQPRVEFREKTTDLDEPRRSYAAFVSDLDRSVGKVLEAIDENGIREKTLVIYLSDHGHSTEERTNFGGGNAGPYRGAKFSVFEGGIRVPCIARLPGVIPEGEVREQLVTSLDWFPTIAELCGVPLPDRRLDGVSLLPILKSAEAPPSHEVFHWQQHNQWAVREGNWKLVVNGREADLSKKLSDEDKIFLSNLAEDVTERHNRASGNPEIVERLTRLHEEWAKTVKEQ